MSQQPCPDNPATHCALLPWLLLCLALLPTISAVNATEGGDSNYKPGLYGNSRLAMAPSATWTVRNDLHYYDADIGASPRSSVVTDNNQVQLLINYLGLVHKPGWKLFGGEFAYGLTIPFGRFDIEGNVLGEGTAQPFDDNNTVVGDLRLMPFHLSWRDDNYHYAVQQYLVAPTGDFNKGDFANLSLNYYSFETNFVFTYYNEQRGQDYNLVAGFNHNAENDVTNYKSGRELHLDFVFNHHLGETLAIGLHGYVLRQISDDKKQGAVLGGFESDAAGIGPALIWTPPQYRGDISLSIKWLHDIHADNRLKGDHLFLSLTLSL